MLESIISKSAFSLGIIVMDRFVHTGPKFKVSITKQFGPTKTKKFPIKTLLKMIDSSIKNPGQAESLTWQKYLS